MIRDPDPDPQMQPLREAKRPEPDPAFIEALLDRMRATHDVSNRRNRSRRWRWTMPLTTGALAAAAILILLLLPLGGAGISLAQVRESLQAVKTVRFDTRLVIDTPHVPERLLVVRTWLDQDIGARSRAEVLGGLAIESVVRWDDQAWLLNHLRRRWLTAEIDRGIERWMRDLDPTRLLLDLRDKAGITATPLDETTAPGTRALMLHGEVLDLPPGASLVLRIDEQTHLPVELVYTLPPNPQGQVRIVLEGFEWGVPIDASRFEPPVLAAPWQEAASIEEMLPGVSEATLLTALGDFARISGGYYPGHPKAQSSLWLIIARHQSGDTDLPSAPPDDLLERLIAGGLYFLELTQRGAGPVYLGHRVTAHQPNDLLMNWQTRSGQQRRINGSLERMTDPNSSPRVPQDAM